MTDFEDAMQVAVRPKYELDDGRMEAVTTSSPETPQTTTLAEITAKPSPLMFKGELKGV